MARVLVSGLFIASLLGASADPLFIRPQSIVQSAGELDVASAVVVGSNAGPPGVVVKLTEALHGVKKAGRSCSIRVLNLASPGDAAEFKKLSRETYERNSFGQGYIIDLTSADGAVIAGDDPLGVWYGASTFLDLLKQRGHQLPRLVIRDHPDTAFRMFHVHGFDKGYGAGDRWTAQDLQTEVFRFIDTASQARMTDMYLTFEAGWINEADRELKVDVDEILGKIIRYGEARRVGIVVELEYAGMEDKAAADRVFRQIRRFEISGAQAQKEVSDLRRPLSPVTQNDYYLKAVRRVFALKPAGLVISFNDFPARECAECRRVYGTDNVLYNGKALAKIARDTDAIRQRLAPDAKLYFLPRFYGLPHWKAHPDALPDLIANSPRSMSPIITGDEDMPYIAALREKYGTQFTFWQNLTSNHMKDKKTWFPVAEFGSAEGKPRPSVILNLGAPPDPQVLSILMGGAWLWNRRDFQSDEMLEESARLIFGPEAAPLIRSYGSLISQPVMWESLGRNIVERVAQPRDTRQVDGNLGFLHGQGQPGGSNREAHFRPDRQDRSAVRSDSGAQCRAHPARL
jgi:hypothetical protein